MSLITKKETITEERDVQYNRCDKCGVEAVASTQLGSNWMTCVKMSEKDWNRAKMREQLVGRAASVMDVATTCTRSLCDKCALLFEKFVEQSNINNG